MGDIRRAKSNAKANKGTNLNFLNTVIANAGDRCKSPVSASNRSEQIISKIDAVLEHVDIDSATEAIFEEVHPIQIDDLIKEELKSKGKHADSGTDTPFVSSPPSEKGAFASIWGMGEGSDDGDDSNEQKLKKNWEDLLKEKKREAKTVRSTEAQSICAILEDCEDQLNILQYVELDHKSINEGLLQSAIDQSLPPDTSLLTSGDAANLQRQAQLEKAYLATKGKPEGSHGNKLKKSIAGELKANTLKLIENISKSKQKAEHVAKLHKDRNFALSQIRSCKDSLASCGRYNALIEELHQIKRKKAGTQEIVSRQGEILLKLKNYGKELQGEAKLKEDELQMRSDVIAMLKDQFQEVRTRTSTESEYVRKEAAARFEGIKKQNEMKEEKLRDKIKLIEREKEREKQAFDEITRFLELDINSLVQCQQDWIEKYDKNLGEKIEEVEILKRKKSHQLQAISDKSEEYVELDEHITQYFQEKEHKIRQERELAQREKAVIVLQAWTRGCLYRMAERSSKKGKGGKKKGKKK
eukprot:Nk52_evm8s328 gene=Nk52_evmTU8s328